MGEHLKIVSAAHVSAVVLASDGYPFLKGTLKDSEEALHSLLASDPLLFREYRSPKAFLPANNSYDDRAYIRFAP